MGRADRKIENYAIVVCWGVIEECLQKFGVGSHCNPASGWEAGATFQGLLPLWTSLRPREGVGAKRQSRKVVIKAEIPEVDVHGWKLIGMHSFPNSLS